MTFLLSGQDQGGKLPEGFEEFPESKKVQALSDMCWQNREKNTMQAVEYGEWGIEIATREGFDKELSTLFNYMGVIYQHYKGETERAIIYYNKALNYALLTKDSIEIAYVYNNLGDAFYLIGNVPLASDYAERSMDIFRSLDYKPGIAYSYINMGLVNRISRNFEESLKYFEDAIRIRETLNDSTGAASATLEVARTYYEMGRLEEAKRDFLRSLNMHRRIDNKNYMAHSYHGLGDVYFKVNKLDSALFCYRSALNLSEERTNPSGIIDNQLGIAMIYAKTGRRKEGEGLLDQALEKAVKTGIVRNLLNVYRTRAEFYHGLYDYKKASDNYQEYITIYDSLFSQLQFQTLEEIKNRFEITEQMNMVNEDLAAKKKEQLYYVSLIFLLLVIAAVLVLRYRTRLKLTKKLEASNQAKDKAFSIISHDMVSPFNSLIGFSELLVESLENKEYGEAREYSQVIHRTSTETYDMIMNLLNWSRSQRDRISINPVIFSITELLHLENHIIENQAAKKDITVEVKTEEDANVYADKDLISIVVRNLLNNAVKFTPEGGMVSVMAVQQDSDVIVSVKDTGTGIPSEKIPDLLSGNMNVSTPGTNEEKGTGLGLLVCKEFVERNNGEIWVESTEGKGTEFFFTIPSKE